MTSYYDFYTYAYLRKTDLTPYYIGKGRKRRAWSKNHGKIAVPKDKSQILILTSNLSEEEAWRHEIYMIAVFGRKDLGTGILHNRTNGGEGAGGAVRSEENKKKVGDRSRGTIGITDGKLIKRIKPHEEIPKGWERGTPESFKQAVRDNHHDVSGEKNPTFGKRRITNGKSERRIPFDDPIPEGWREGAIPKLFKCQKPRPVEITSVEHNFALVFDSLKEAAEFIGVKPTGLNGLVGDEKRCCKGWKIRRI